MMPSEKPETSWKASAAKWRGVIITAPSVLRFSGSQ
jgi:hypothetical protein